MHDNFETLKRKILGWSADRGILQHSTAQMQFLKAVSEMGELADAIAKNQPVEMQDAVGDVLVCLINMCYLADIEPIDCLDLAWRTIKDRKGQMLPGGVFVKQETSGIGALLGD